MNEHEQNQPSVDPTLAQRGFEDESTPVPANNAARRGKSADQLKANFNSVFGHGLGKASLVLVLVFVVIAIAFAIRGFNKPDISAKAAQVDVPRTPAPKVSVEPIDDKEAERRSQLASLEAEAAVQKGQTYQPGFNPVINASGVQPTAAVQTFAPAAASPPPGTQPLQLIVPAGQSTAANGANATAEQKAQQQEEQQRLAELEKQRTVRDKYVEQLRGGVEAQADELLNGKGGSGGMSGRGSYSTVSYVSPPKAPTGTQQGGGAGPSGGQGLANVSSAPGSAASGGAASNKKAIFKAGKAIFATLDAEVNTDDGGDVFATVRGGKYDGAKLIGKIEPSPRNIRLKFTTLAPQDDRPTLQVSALAIREDDARQGMAENIDHHTLERYTALFAGSVLAGIGKAAAQPQGDTIVLPNGQVVVSQPELTNKRISMFALGEVGTSAGSEIRKSFTQPPTYSTPAHKGIGVIFLADVTEK